MRRAMGGNVPSQDGGTATANFGRSRGVFPLRPVGCGPAGVRVSSSRDAEPPTSPGSGGDRRVPVRGCPPLHREVPRPGDQGAEQPAGQHVAGPVNAQVHQGNADAQNRYNQEGTEQRSSRPRRLGRSQEQGHGNSGGHRAVGGGHRKSIGMHQGHVRRRPRPAHHRLDYAGGDQ